MSGVPKPLLSEADYLAQERQADFKSEFYRGEVLVGDFYRKVDLSGDEELRGGAETRSAEP